MAEPNNAGLKAMVTIAMIIAIIGGVAAIVRPIQQQMDAMSERIARMETRSKEESKALDDKLQIEILKSDERSKARLEKLEEWQKWWYRERMHTNVHEELK